tara:strand:- start:9141 stop:9557 length:417 start_codon:yes stop_codon:yes gene_type:complete
VAVLNKAWYEWESHSPILKSAPGIESASSSRFMPARLTIHAEITDAHITAVLKSRPHEVNDGMQSDALAAVLTFTDAMTLTVTVPEDVFANLKKHFSDKEVVEITATIAAYNCVSRFLVALDVGERNVQQGPKEGGEE